MTSEVVRAYYSLTKPGVLYGNILTTFAGFLFAAGFYGTFNTILFVGTIVGTTLVIGAACALNNVLDQDIDQKMERTKNRVIVTGEIDRRSATIFALTLLIIGLVTLIVFVNWLVVLIGVIGFVVYVWLYGALSKRISIHGTMVGSISGAMPIVAGYCAVANRFDLAAGLLFLALFFWQFPEFFSIAIYRRKEYKKAGIPVMSVVEGVTSTRWQIQIYTFAYVITTLLLFSFGYVGYLYFIVMVIAGGWWINLALRYAEFSDIDTWARHMFRMSIRQLLLLCLMLPIGALLP